MIIARVQLFDYDCQNIYRFDFKIPSLARLLTTFSKSTQNTETVKIDSKQQKVIKIVTNKIKTQHTTCNTPNKRVNLLLLLLLK